ncbi:ferredoxin [Rhodococcus olei]|uniref:Ferredoxin n=1 Tax=Rhodococcus olei TaxID=2161675 RepID=A0ABP8PQA1_9NOCA
MKITVDMVKCEDHGQCVFAAPDVFDYNDDDTLVWDSEPSEGQRAKVTHAAAVCPVSAITIES